MILIKKNITCMLFFCLFIILLNNCNKNKEKLNNDDISLKKDTELKAEEIKKISTFGVIRVDRLRFRETNNLSSKTLRYLDKGTIVTVLKKDNKRVKIGPIEDYWFNIEYDGIKGWIFGYYFDSYSSYEDAQSQANQLKNPEVLDNEKNNYDDSIDKNLFFISDGKLLQIIDGKNGNAKKLKTQAGLIVTYYFFNNINSHIYYIAKHPKNLDKNGNLYIYDLETEKNQIISNNIFSASINDERNILLTAGIQRVEDENYWVIKLANLKEGNDLKFIAKIKIRKGFVIKESDFFSRTLQRELGSLVYLDIDIKGNFIYFKPPEENLAYLISIFKGEYIQAEIKQPNIFEIDSSRFISIYSEEDSNGITINTIILKDKFSGMEKEIISSKLYPINFSLSQRKNLLSISMIDVNKNIDGYYPSSIYVLSLITYSLIPISTDEKSYQAKWSKFLLK